MILASLLLVVHYFAVPCNAAHPLITDDTGTQGRGRGQLEINFEFDFDKESEEGITVKEKVTEIGGIISIGMADNADIVLGVPYQWIRLEEDGMEVSRENGLSDMSFELKWRFFEKEGIGLAVKPGITFPTGDDKKGLGTGKATYSLYFISTMETGPWTFHTNLGYIGNENRVDERTHLWHASFATEFQVINDLKLVANIGIERNPDEASETDPTFILGGIIYSILENLDIDLGVKGALNHSEVDYAVMAGIALRF